MPALQEPTLADLRKSLTLSQSPKKMSTCDDGLNASSFEKYNQEDEDGIPHEMYMKEDTHFKNEKAHQLARAKKSNPLCSYCMRRACTDWECDPVKGTKSLKKTKHFERHKSKLESTAVLNPSFTNIRNGEIEV